MAIRRAGIVLVVATLLGASEASGQAWKTEIEVGGNYRHLSQGFPPWTGAYFRLVQKTGERDTWSLEILRQREFDDTGTFFSVANSHTINDDWYLFAAAGTSYGGFFFPEVRLDAQLNKKWLSKRQLVSTIGGGYFKAKDEHRDSSLFLGAAYYLESPWIVQGGIRWNRSMPGSVISRSQFIALTQGRELDHYIVIRAETGREAYQALGPASILVDFPSHSISITWKQWLGQSWGFNGLTEYYKSDVYRRMGVSFGIFKSF